VTAVAAGSVENSNEEGNSDDAESIFVDNGNSESLEQDDNELADIAVPPLISLNDRFPADEKVLGE